MDGDRLDDAEVALVLRRAAELDHRPATGAAGVELAAVEEAAAEVGLSPESVRQAVAELRAGALRYGGGPAPGRVLGPPALTVSRVVAGPAPEVTARLHDHLRRQLFCLRRDQDGHSLWERRDDVAAGLRRGLDSLRERRLVFGEVGRLLAVVVAEPGGGDRVVVRLELDVRSARRSQTAAVAGGGALGAAVVGGTLLVGADPSALLLAGPVGGGMAAAGHHMGKWVYRRRVAELELAAEGVLDRLERRAGAAPRRRPSGRP